MDKYQQFIHKSRYARWIKEEGRRETWEETVQRYVDFWTERGQIDSKVEMLLMIVILRGIPLLVTINQKIKRSFLLGFW